MLAIMLAVADLVLPAVLSTLLRSIFNRPKEEPEDPLARSRAADEAVRKVDDGQEAIDDDPNNRDRAS